MDILVVDTIHGGEALARHLFSRGHRVDMVDVYRHATGIPESEACANHYDLVIAPVHLNPDHPVLTAHAPRVCTHHEAVNWILDGEIPHPSIEITGGRGKTTTAFALAHLMDGPGILHTSAGTWSYPGRELLWKKSITPASVIDAALLAHTMDGWLIAEESLGVAGFGDVGVLTSGEDYPIAAGHKRALEEKIRLISRSPTAVIAPGIRYTSENGVHASDIVDCSGMCCRYSAFGIEGAFCHPLLHLDAYRIPLMVAAAAACVLAIDPAALESFEALPGRMSSEWREGRFIVDNANSGANAATAIEAAAYARRVSRVEDVILVIGTEAATICEGFPLENILDAVRTIQPARVILVREPGANTALMKDAGIPYEYAESLEEGYERAWEAHEPGSIVLAVKTWR